MGRSSLIDNVPLTAALLKADLAMTQAEWLLLTYATGVGGSILIIGSAAGIIATSKIKELTFGSYFKMAGYLLFAYSLGYAGVYLLDKLSTVKLASLFSLHGNKIERQPWWRFFSCICCKLDI